MAAAKKKPAKAAKRKRSDPVVVAETPKAEVVLAYKGFDKNLVCNPNGQPFQYEFGKTYTNAGPVVRCAAGGFHSCEMPLDVLTYYKPNTSRFAIVEASGHIDRDKQDSKIASATITIQSEIRLPDLIARAVRWILDRAKGNTATGDYGHAAATGDSGHAAATGYSGHAAATGDSGHAAATGNYGHAAATGHSGHAAATGDYGTAFAGFSGKAKAGASGAFCIAWFDQKAKRARLIVGTPGENGIKADTLYRVNDSGQLVEVA